jgi:molybdate transport system ATP-binding protein
LSSKLSRSGHYLDVTLKHVDLNRGDVAVLRDICWRIRPGERWVLAGGNGAGKTQLLKLIAGDVWPTPTGRERRVYRWRGTVFDEPGGIKEEIAYLGPERQDRYERYNWNFTAAAVIGTGIHRSDIPLDPLNSADARRIAALLRRLRIATFARRRFLTLSYGERRQVLLARALACQPSLLLLDEVANGLDTAHRERLMRFLESTRRSPLPWILTTHRAEDVPASATHIAILRNGRLVHRGRLSAASLRKAFGAPPASPRRRGRRGVVARKAEAGRARDLVGVHRASVYVDGVRLLSGLNFTVREGECWVVHGANGAGKSTLLRTIYGDHPVAAGGRIERAGIEPGVPLAEFRAWVGYVAPQLQTDHPQYLDVLDTVGSGLHASIGLNEPLTDAEQRRARSALADFGLAGYARRSLRALSYGQLRRVLFARAWVARPRLLLLDEPYAGVDTPTRRALIARIEALLQNGLTLIIATHHGAEWPAGATHELELSGGRPVYCGPVRR